jgi:hypothetical protein
MSQMLPAVPGSAVPAASTVALESLSPSLEELFAFMSEAELRVQSLRMRLVERTLTARGEETVTSELVLRHPGQARVTRRAGDDPLGRAYDVWSSDGSAVTTFDAADQTASVRPVRRSVLGATDPRLPRFAQLHVPLTLLPPDTLVDTFVHPAGFVRQVLLSGPVTLEGTAPLAGGREAFLLRCVHPRSTAVLTDRPDRWLEIGVDRQTGLLLRLVEHVGEVVTRDAEVTSLEVDPPIPDEAFIVHLPEDIRMIF